MSNEVEPSLNNLLPLPLNLILPRASGMTRWIEISKLDVKFGAAGALVSPTRSEIAFHLEANRDSAANAIVGHNLQGRVVDQDWQIGADFGADFA
jgi:hypothetical protein